MANVIINDTNLFNIANAIRSKNGSSDTYKPSEMAAAITNLPSGGGGDIDIEPIVLTGAQNYAFAGKIGSIFIELFGDKITTKDLTNMSNMFSEYQNESVPFDLNGKTTASYVMLNGLFSGANLKSLPKIKGNFKPYELSNMFANCKMLREIPDDYFDEIDFTQVMNATSAYSYGAPNMYQGCISLRKLPIAVFEKMNPVASSSYVYFSSGFASCYSLDELVNLPVPYTAAYTSNFLGSTFKSCNRLKRITFALYDGAPKSVNWKSQNLDLSSYVGYAQFNYLLDYNSGITADKEVKDAATYEALKNDPDWFTMLVAYSRYNRTSAVETINSLPDTSAYLASAGGTNTIKFKGESGSATDGGAINTMTEAEIAVATAKGWTVSFA